MNPLPISPISVNSVCKDLYGALWCETKWMNLTTAILDFAVCLYGGSELSKHLSKCLIWMHIVLWTQVLEAVCKRD